MHALKVLLVWLASFIIIGAIALAAMGYYYRNTFYPGTAVGGINLVHQPRETGQKLVEDKVSTYLNHPVIVVFPDITKPREAETNNYPNIEIATTTSKLGLSVVGKEHTDQAWALGHTYNWMWPVDVSKTLLSGRRWNLTYSIDQTAVRTFIDTEIIPKIVSPTPAKVVLSGSNVTVENPQPGLEIDQAALSASLVDILNSLSDKNYDSKSYLKAPATEVLSPVDRLKVQPFADRLNALGNQKISFKDDDKYFSPSRTQLLGWYSVVQNDKGELALSVSNDAISKYINSLAGSVPTKTIDSKTSLASAVKAISANTDLGVDFYADQVVTVSLATSLKPEKKEAVPGEVTLGKYEGKYIEINLADQKMYLINGTQLERSFVVSSGKWSTPTPKGEFKIQGKILRAYSSAYGLYMPYWQNFLDGEYGIHGLPEWPNGYKEGENHLGIPVSHGCVRLGSGADVEVYNWTESGVTPVYIH